MANISDLYPPTPKNVPANLTRPTASYRNQVLVVLASLIVFLIVYLVLTVGSAYLCYWSFASLVEDKPATRQTYTSFDTRGRPITRSYRQADPPNPVVLIPLGIGAGLLCLFLVKGLFKKGNRSTGLRVEVLEADQPELFAFIRQLCKDTRAPFPKRVYLLPEVTASVSFDESFLNLVFPSQKNLNIGLGLVNQLNLAEFKAVLAHEFGHFSQNSMRLGSYVYTANRVIADVVYGRDWLDDLVAAAARIDIRLSVFVWTFAGGLWVIRKGLHYLFRGINFASVALSRQMEYNADLVAVSVTGSDPLIFALARLDFASESLGQAWGDLMAAADHGRYSRDIYYHQTKAAEYLKAKRGDNKLGEVPDLPDDPTISVEVFKPEDTSVPKMWATHPSNADREDNAKARYFRGPEDDRSAWLLFRGSEAMKAVVTLEAYKLNRKEKIPELEDPEEVQAFIDAEHTETTYPAKYHGLYENRYIKPGELAELRMTSYLQEFEVKDRLAAAHAALAGEHLKERMTEHRQRQEEVGRLSGLAGGFVALTGRDFEHRGRRYGLTHAKRLLKKVEDEINNDFTWMHEHDREAYRVHLVMARQLGDELTLEFEKRYTFHLAVQSIHQMVTGVTNHVQATLGAIQGQRQVEQQDFVDAVAVLREAAVIMKDQLDAADELRTPALTNMPAGTKLGEYLFEGKVVRPLSRETQTIDGHHVHELMTQASEITDKGARILFKSLGAILTLQDKIAADWHALNAAPPGEQLANDEPTAQDKPAGREGINRRKN